MKKNILKKGISGFIALTLTSTLFLAGCGSKSEDTSGSKKANEDNDKLKVALVVNQKFGDNGPMDNLAEGADMVEKEFGIDIKRLESATAANYEEDVRAMAGEGYDLIVTTFGYMTDATKLVAKEYPDTKFAAVFQSINNGSEKFNNVWDTEFHGEAAFHIAGYIAGLMTETNKVGLVIGGEEPSPNAEGNGFMRGVKAANPNAEVIFSFVGSYEDPAKAKEIASAMADQGVDYIQGNAGASNAGLVEVAKNKGILVSAEITDFYDQYDGYTGIVKIGFGDTLYKAVESMQKKEFPGGKHGIRDMSNGGYYIDWETFERFAKGSEKHGARMLEAIEKAKVLEKEINSGAKKIEFESTAPNWEKIKAE